MPADGMKGTDIELGWIDQAGQVHFQDRYAYSTSRPSSTNILIFAYGLEDPDMSQSNGLIHYHENRRGSRIIPLRSYANPKGETAETLVVKSHEVLKVF
ncbi:unnamed protein product [Rotaria sp. Silwood2]|nr:unnamed protein product [Rotaria sp. Silwood2]